MLELVCIWLISYFVISYKDILSLGAFSNSGDCHGGSSPNIIKFNAFHHWVSLLIEIDVLLLS